MSTVACCRSASCSLPLVLVALSLGLTVACAAPQQALRAPVAPGGDDAALDAVRQRVLAGRDEQRPAVRDDDGVLRFAVISDLNGRYGSVEYDEAVHRAVARIGALQPDLVISSGDMVAGQKNDLDYAAMWDAFHAAVTEPLEAAGIPLAVSPGNHDASAYPKFAVEREHYAAEWSSRKPALEFVEDTFYPFRYAFVEQGVLFVALDITTSDPIDDEQYRWLDAVLARHQDIETKIVFGHVPLFQLVGERKGHEHTADERLEALLNERGVAMYISGHHHAYYPGRRGDLRLLGVGCLGGGARPLVGVEGPPVRTLVMVEVDKYGVRSVEALAAPDFLEPVERSALPERLVGYNEAHALLRDDVGEPRYVAERRERMAADGLLAVAPATAGEVATGLDVVVAAAISAGSAARSGGAPTLVAALESDDASDAAAAPGDEPGAVAVASASEAEAESLGLGRRAVLGAPAETLAPPLAAVPVLEPAALPAPALRMLERRVAPRPARP